MFTLLSGVGFEGGEMLLEETVLGMELGADKGAPWMVVMATDAGDCVQAHVSEHLDYYLH